MEEIWKNITETNEKYSISNMGRVKNNKTGKLKCLDKNRVGYLRVTLEGRQRKFVHRLVAEYFVDGYFENAVVNHKDLDKLNNRFDNLEWVTRSENSKHAHKNGHQPGSFKFKKCLIDGVLYNSVKEAREALNMPKSTFHKHINEGKLKLSYVSNDHLERE